MAINFFSEQTEIPNFNKKDVKSWISAVIKNHDKKIGEINFIFTNDEFLLKINQEYLNHNTYTDIISFDYSTKKIIHGDLYISTERVEENAKKFNTETTEIYRVIIHGILHLLGYKDSTPQEKLEIRSMEDKCLSQINLNH